MCSHAAVVLTHNGTLSGKTYDTIKTDTRPSMRTENTANTEKMSTIGVRDCDIPSEVKCSGPIDDATVNDAGALEVLTKNSCRTRYTILLPLTADIRVVEPKVEMLHHHLDHRAENEADIILKKKKTTASGLGFTRTG